MSSPEHWNRLYETKPSDAVSWFQPTPTTSLRLLDLAGLNSGSCVIDIGGGDSRLVDALLDRGVGCVTVLDISAAAIARAQTRLASRASHANFIVADVTAQWAVPPVDVWHDRAAFHFLVEESDRAQYVRNLRGSLKSGGHVLIATFAPDGPTKCSGLPVMRYSAELLGSQLGNDFDLVQSLVEPHTTPAQAAQSFMFALFRRTT
jgi:trans-aconitate methyltransferase